METSDIKNSKFQAINPRQKMNFLNDFQSIPGVGKKLAQDFLDLGYRNVDELRAEDPEEMYQSLMSLRGQHIDRCVLYVFRCAVYYSNHSIHEPELLKWWNWKDKP